MTRDEHLAWCKRRALEYLAAGEPLNAVTSMGSDLTKHEDTRPLVQDGAMAGLFLAAAMAAQQGDADFVRRYIEGFN